MKKNNIKNKEGTVIENRGGRKSGWGGMKGRQSRSRGSGGK